MIFLLGLHHLHFSEVLNSVVSTFRDEAVTGLPVRDGKFDVEEYAGECLETIVAFQSGRPDSLNKGLCVLAISSPSIDFSKAAPHFFPFSLYKNVKFNRIYARSPSQIRRDKNDIAKLAIDELRRLVKNKNYINTHLQSRANRTPLLLPIEHFDEDILRNKLQELWLQLPSAPTAAELIEMTSAAVENQHPFGKRAGTRTGCFSNSKGVWFSVPGRDLHATAHVVAAGHNSKCFLNAVVRVGGAVRDGFHYDCTRGGERHSGTFANCHGQLIQKVGKPHLNVYPNDYIR